VEVVVVPEEVVPEYIVGTPNRRGTIAAGNSQSIAYGIFSSSVREYSER